MTANVMSTTLKDRYLEQLSADERAISEAATTYETAKAALDMGLLRYTALRDFVTEQLGTSPYMPGVEWPGDSDSARWDDWPERGHYRFSGMKIGDAVLQALAEAQAILLREKPGTDKLAYQTLDQIVARLADGGLGCPETVQARAINAALQAMTKAAAIKKATRVPTNETVYAYKPPVEDGNEGDNSKREEVAAS